MATAFDRQIQNRNFLSPVGFKFMISKVPKADFFSNEASIPGINLGFTLQPNYLRDIPVAGDKLTYEDFTLSFFVDENLENYLEIHNWIYGLGYPESISEFQELITQSDGQKDVKEQFSDGTLSILNSNFNVSTRVKFRDLFPISLSSLEFTATENDYTYFTATATFKYLFYTIEVDT